MDINIDKLIGFETVISKEAIPNADRIELVKLSGWSCICNKDDFNVNDTVLHIRIDTDINTEKSHFSNLSACAPKSTPWMHLKTKKIRGVYSQGLIIGKIVDDQIITIPNNQIIPTSDLMSLEDIENKLGVKKHLSEIDSQCPSNFNPDSNSNKLQFPVDIIGKTDELNAKSHVKLFNDVISRDHYVTLKMDGSSLTLIWRENKMTICSRNWVITEEETSLNLRCMFNFIKNNNYEEILRSKYLNRNIVFQGEFCGPKVNGNNLKFDKYNWFIFTIKDLDNKVFLNYEEMLVVNNDIGLKTVPLILIPEIDNENNKNLDFYQNFCNKIKYAPNNVNLYEIDDSKKSKLGPAEGIVIRNTKDKYHENRPYGCKIINQNYDL